MSIIFSRNIETAAWGSIKDENKVKLKDLKLKAVRPKKGGLKINKITGKIDCRLLSCVDGLGLFKEDLKNHE